jgi:CheY-like chemotaxis protein
MSGAPPNLMGAVEPADDQWVMTPKGDTPSTSGRLGGSLRLLIVDDEEETRALLLEVMEAEGMVVVGAAGDGLEAIQLADERRPDVVLMDLRMPGMDGFEATRQIRDRHPWMQVVILTAYQDPHPDRSAQAAGAFAYLIKGCSSQLMCDVIMHAWRHAAGHDRGRKADSVDALGAR